MRAALNLEKECHAENWIQNSIWNSNNQKINKQTKNTPKTKLVGICAPLLELVCLVFIYL